LSARPRHLGQDSAKIADRGVKKLPARLGEIAEKLAPSMPMDVWFRDEMRLGHKNKVTRALSATRAAAVPDLRTKIACLFGRICFFQ